MQQKFKTRFAERRDHIYARQGFRSVIGGAISSAVEGHFGSEHVPSRLQSRVDAGEIFLWSLMAVLWAFDVETVARRSLMSKWISDKTSVRGCYDAVFAGRQALGDRVRGVENCPQHEEIRGQLPNIWQPDG